MTPQNQKPNYADLVDAWLMRKKAGATEPIPGDWLQKTMDFAERFATNRETPYPVADATLGALFGRVPGIVPRTPVSEPRVSDFTRELIGGIVERAAKLPMPNPVDPIGLQGASSVNTDRNVDEWRATGEGVGEMLPSMVSTAPLFALGLPGLAVAVAKTEAEGYTPQADPVAGFLGGLTMAAGPTASRVGARAAEKVAESFVLPSVKEIVAGGAPVTTQGLRAAVDPAVHTTMKASRVGGSIAGGTALGEGQRQASSLAETGELAPLTAPAMLADLGLNVAFTVPHIQAAMRPGGKPIEYFAPRNAKKGTPVNAVFNAESAPLVAEVMDRALRAQKIRNEAAAAADKTGFDATRGARIAASHEEIFRTAEAGGDLSEAVGRLKANWDDLPSPEQGVKIMRSINDEANLTGIPDEAFFRIVAGVQGRYEDMFKADPSLPGPMTVSELVKRNYLPKITKEWVSQNWPDAVDQMLGDYEGAKVNLMNRILAYQMENIPGALERMRRAPLEEGLTRQGLKADTNRDKNAAYIDAVTRVAPHLKNARVPNYTTDAEGNATDQSLLRALYDRDKDLSQGMFDVSGPFTTSNTAKYDAWRDAFIEIAATYDPVTRKGKYTPTANSEPIEVSFEDLVEKKDGKYVFKPRVRREMERAGSSAAPRDALAFVDEMFRPKEQIEEDIRDDPEGFVEARKGLLKSSVDDNLLTDAETGQLELDADAKGLEGAERAAYIAQQTEVLRDAQAPVLGVNLPATKSEAYYDIALHIMNKIDRSTNAELWNRYGGARIFGKGASSPGKFQLFKDALMAKMESDMDSTGQLTKAQVKFYEAWKANKDAKQGEVKPLGKEWHEKREAFRHALRLYWRQVGLEETRGLFMSMLDDKPEYQNMLRAKGESAQAKQAQSQPVEGQPLTDRQQYDAIQQQLASLGPTKFGTPEYQQLWQQSEDIKNRYQGMPPQAEQATQPSLASPSSIEADSQGMYYYVGNKRPVIDAIRHGRGFARKLGWDEKSSEGFGVLFGQFVGAFEELAMVGKLKGVPTSTGGINISSEKIGGPVVGINFDSVAQNERHDFQAGARVIELLSHELTHIYSKHNTSTFSGIFRQARSDAYQSMLGLFEDLGFEETARLNDVVQQVFYPSKMAPKTQTSLSRGDFAQEAVSKFMETFMLGAFTKANPWQAGQLQKAEKFAEALNWTPDQVQALSHFAMRDLANMAGALEDYYKRYTTLEKPKALQYIRPLMGFAKQFLDTSPEQLVKYKQLVENLSVEITASGAGKDVDSTILKTYVPLEDAKLFELVNENKISYAQNKPTAADFQEVRKLVLGEDAPIVFEHEKRLGRRTPPWSRYAGMFFQALRRYQRSGVPLAENAMALINDLEPAYARLTKTMHEPFLTFDKEGRMIYDPENPVLKLLQQSTPEAVRGRQAISDLYLYANEHGKPVVITDEAGRVTVNPEASAEVVRKIGSFKPETQQAVLEGLSRLVRGYQRAAEVAYGSQVDFTAGRVAALLMTVNKGRYYDQAFNTAKRAVEAGTRLQEAQVLAAKPQQEQNPLFAQQLQERLVQATQDFTASLVGLDGDEIAVVQKYLLGQDGLAQKLNDLRGFFDKRKDWFGSESRPGNIFVISTQPDGEFFYAGATNMADAKRLTQELSGQGHHSFQYIDKNRRDAFKLFQSPDAVVENFIKLEENAWNGFRHEMRERLSDEDNAYLDQLGYTPGEAASKYVQNKAVERYMKKRELLPGRERLDAFEVFRDYTGRLSGSVARRGLRQQIDLLKNDPRVKRDGEFLNTVEEAMNALMTPIDERFIAARAGVTSYFLGVPNFVGPLVEGTQSASTILPYIIERTGFVNGVDVYKRSLADLFKRHSVGQTLESKRLLASATEKEWAAPKTMSLDESLELYYKRALDEGAFNYGPIYSATFSRDHQMMTQQAFGLGKSTPKTREQMVTDPLYWLAQKTMYVYSQASAVNNKIAFLGGLRAHYAEGLRGQELYLKARAFQSLATYGGGKANSLGMTNKISNPLTRSSFALIESLQRYAFGNVTQWKDMVADVIGKTDLTPLERKRAAQALGTATGWQFLMAGALGIPGAAIALGLLKEMTGGRVDLKQDAREMWVDLMKRLEADDELAVTIANYAQNGITSQMLGTDISSRVTVNSILGFNQYNGFSMNDAFGATGGVIERFIEGTKHVAKGELVKAGKSFAPPSMSGMIEMAESKVKYGDFSARDKSGRPLMKLTPGEATRYALGARPQRLRQIRDRQEAMRTSKKNFDEVRDATLDNLAQDLLKGNTQAVLQYLQEHQVRGPVNDIRPTARSIIDRAVSFSQPLDPLAAGSVGNEESQRRIAQSFGNVAPRQSEVQGLAMREQLNASIGHLAGEPATEKEYEQAQLIDQLVQLGMTRGEALQMLEVQRVR